MNDAEMEKGDEEDEEEAVEAPADKMDEVDEIARTFSIHVLFFSKSYFSIF